jgi:predicted metal-dependent hydrolase
MTLKTARQLDQEIAEHQVRERLLKRVRKLLDKWQPILGVKIREVHIKDMKTYWGSTNERDSRMWISLELADKPAKDLEYVVVHELVHLRTDGHDGKFYALMDQHLPGWRKQHQTFAGPMRRHS